MNEGKPIGPLRVTTFTCRGCPAFQEKYWKDYLDNDETDSGHAQTCIAANRLIEMYGSPAARTPDWCPAPPTLARTTQDAPDTAAPGAEREG